MNTGQYISGIGHLGLIGWALFGGVFNSEPLPFDVQEVAVITGAEFEAMLATDAQPDADLSQIEAPEAPAPDVAPQPEPPQPDSTPERVEPPRETAQDAPDETPVAPDPPAPAPEPEVLPEPEQVTPPAEDTAVLLPVTSLRPKPRPARRVAPQPVAQPDPDTAVDEVTREETSNAENADQPKPDTEATAPEEAAPEIVTEAEDQPSGAPTRSLRPQARSRPQTQVAEAEEPTSEDEQQTSDALRAALNEALGGGDSASNATPSGPPLTAGEVDALRVAVRDCWVVDVGSQAANVTVTVFMAMQPDGRVETGSLQLVSSSGGSGAAVETAFQTARRAILRCQKGGYDLPSEKYDHWREIEITFNPEKMRLR